MFIHMREDIQTVFRRDPAARTILEVLFLYPGLHALWLHRVAHGLWRRRLYFLGRLFSHFSRAVTGVEIHPGARIGRRVFIDHGMGVVIGETSEIGDDVLMYQGVVLGGTSLEKIKRHPTIEVGAVIGAGAIVLGPIVVGRGARIGAGSVVVKAVPAGATVVGVPARIAAPRDARLDGALDHGELPDPVVRALSYVTEQQNALEDRIKGLEEQVKTYHTVRPAQPDVALSADQCAQIVLQRLVSVLDPEVGVDIVELGLVRSVKVVDNEARVNMVLTSPTCPMAGQLVEQVRRVARGVPGIERVQVLLLDEPWNWEWFVTRKAKSRVGQFDALLTQSMEPVGTAPNEPHSG